MAHLQEMLMVSHVEGTETILAFKVTGDIIASRRIGINNDVSTFALDVTGNGRIRMV